MGLRPLMLSHRTRYKLEEWWTTARPWVLGTLGTLLLVGLWMLLAYSGPGRAVEAVPDEAPKVDDPEFQRRIAQVQGLEERYRVFAAAEIVSDEALAVLSEAVEIQRGIARSSLYGDYQQQRELERLESQYDIPDAE